MRKKILAALLFCLLLGVGFNEGCYWAVEIGGAAQILAPEEVGKRDAIVVLGALVYPSGEPSPMLRDRLDRAAELYFSGVSDKILLTGDSEKESYDEIAGMRAYLLGTGVPPEALFEDPLGLDTYDSVYRSAAVYCLEQPVYVTQDYHLRRTLYIAEALGIDAVGVAAEQKSYPGDFKRWVRENLSRIKAVIECAVKPQPKNLGEKRPLSSPEAEKS